MHRTPLVIIAVFLGIIAALLTGILTAAGRAHLTAAIISGGGAFVVVPLVLLIEGRLGLFLSF
jgi:hypothetical protein